jgi:hypothetical protein
MYYSVPLKKDLFLVLLVLLLFIFFLESHAFEHLWLDRRSTQGFGTQEGHFHRGFAPVVAVVALTRRTPGPDLIFGQTRQDAKNNGRFGVESNIHNALADGIGNVFKMHGITLDQDAGTDNGVDGAAQGQELGRHGQFEGSGHGRFKDIVVLDLAFGQRLLDAHTQIVHVLIVPSGLDNSNAHVGAVQGGRKRDVRFGSLYRRSLCSEMR